MRKIVPHNKFTSIYQEDYSQKTFKTIGLHKAQISTHKLNFKANKLFIGYSSLSFIFNLNVYSPFIDILHNRKSLFERNKNAFCYILSF